MDVQAVTATLASSTFSSPPSPGFTGGPPPQVSAPVAPVQTAVTTVPVPTATPGGTSTPSPAVLSPADRSTSSPSPSLPASIAKLYNEQEQNVEVSFRVEKGPNEIVTVFTDKHTGKVIVQFPSETLVALAQFFQKLDGSVVDKKA